MICLLFKTFTLLITAEVCVHGHVCVADVCAGVRESRVFLPVRVSMMALGQDTKAVMMLITKKLHDNFKGAFHHFCLQP